MWISRKIRVVGKLLNFHTVLSIPKKNESIKTSISMRFLLQKMNKLSHFHSIKVGKTERNQGYLISAPKSLPEDEQQKVVELEHEDRLAAADKTLHLIHHYQITMSNLSI